jgi:hypothetical protein
MFVLVISCLLGSTCVAMAMACIYHRKRLRAQEKGERRSYAHLSEEDNYLDNTLGEDQDNEFNEDLADPFIEDFASQEMEMRSFPTKATTQLPPLAGGMEDEGGQEAVDMFADTRQFRPWVELDDDGANDHRVDDHRVDDDGGGVGNASGSNEEVDLFAERNT